MRTQAPYAGKKDGKENFFTLMEQNKMTEKDCDILHFLIVSMGPPARRASFTAFSSFLADALGAFFLTTTGSQSCDTGPIPAMASSFLLCQFSKKIKSNRYSKKPTCSNDQFFTKSNSELQSARAFKTSVRLSASTPFSTDIATTRPRLVHSRALTLTLILEVLRCRGSQIPSADPRSMVRAPWKG